MQVCYCFSLEQDDLALLSEFKTKGLSLDVEILLVCPRDSGCLLGGSAEVFHRVEILVGLLGCEGRGRLTDSDPTRVSRGGHGRGSFDRRVIRLS